jgi:hypothetical protein
MQHLQGFVTGQRNNFTGLDLDSVLSYVPKAKAMSLCRFVALSRFKIEAHTVDKGMYAGLFKDFADNPSCTFGARIES